MTTSTWAFGKATAAGRARLPTPRTTTKSLCSRARAQSSSAAKPASSPNGHAQGQPKHGDSADQRELFMNVLTANATKRDAKQYLARFKPPKQSPKGTPDSPSALQEERNARHRQDQNRLDRSGVNLGGLYAPARAIAESPQFTQPHVKETTTAVSHEEMHVALVCLRAPETLDDATMDGVATTLSQLVKLDMRIAVVLDCGTEADLNDYKDASATTADQADRLAKAIGRHSTEGGRLVSGAVEINEGPETDGGNRCKRTGTATVCSPNLLLEPLKRSIIPIVPTLVHTTAGQIVRTPATTIMTALSGLFSGLQIAGSTLENSHPGMNTTLDRIIVLDTVGGIPSRARGDSAHVFINLEQEYDDIQQELAHYGQKAPRDETTPDLRDVYGRHRSNLTMAQACLALLPSASSAVIITPQEAAVSSQSSNEDLSIGTGTRRRKNTLIHNLLTNRPMVSSSLPAARMPATPTMAGTNAHIDIPQATLVKRGMPVTIIPAAEHGYGWLTPEAGSTTLDLETDPRVDLPRLVHLIEDSFRRKLDVRHYLDRIRGRTAGLIVAGEYDGGAILTWERPPNAPDSDRTRLVPYLDKFAVLSSSQGSSGVADIVFQSMVRTCFPNGVCWRSRKDNPVNKWYFERSEGTWQIPDSNWTIFWTGEGVAEDVEKWEDYVGVCRSVGPSWAEVKSVVD